MNAKVSNVERIIQMLDEYIEVYGNYPDLEKAADHLAKYHKDIYVTGSMVQVDVTFLINVGHTIGEDERTIEEAAKDYVLDTLLCPCPYEECDMSILDTDIAFHEAADTEVK